MLTVGKDVRVVERKLRTGLLACPLCGGRLVPWSHARTRIVFGAGTVRWRLRPRRARCAGCGVTHVLLPVSVLARRRDEAGLIGAALGLAASGVSCAGIARLLSETEQADWWARSPDNGLWHVGGFVAFPSVLASIRVGGPRHDPIHPRRDVADLLVIACYLHGHRVAGSIVASMSEPRWVQHGMHSGPLSIPVHSSDPATISSDALREVVATIPKLAQFSLRQPRSSKDLALHRFATGIARQDDADAVLDFVIALEALLLPLDTVARHSDLSYRFRIHGAMFIAESADLRREVFRQLRDLYEMRSHLVHGGEYPVAADIRETRSIACALAARGLRRAVREGFPDANKFNAMVLDA